MGDFKLVSSRRALIAAAASSMVSISAPLAFASSGPINRVPQWDIFEVKLDGPITNNPVDEVKVTAIFTSGNRTKEVTGFYDGGGKYIVRFMPDALGNWTYRTSSNHRQLAGRSGSFVCVSARTGSHGPVGVRATTHFGHADGTPYFPFGTTCYAWIHQPKELREQTLATLKAQSFNKIRMCVFPKHYWYNRNDPELFAFEKKASGEFDFDRLNPAFFRHLEKCISDLNDLGIQADIIIFHPYDRWGFAKMTAEQDDRYLRYLVSRLSAFQNVWWSMANEYDYMRAKTVQDFDRFFHIVEKEDNVGHLRSIHYGTIPYDYGRTWVTHGSLQTNYFDKVSEQIATWRKPIIYDEVQYEGNLNRRWGNLSGQEMCYRFWRGVVSGAYVTHGETIMPTEGMFKEQATASIWWSHGGKLLGESPARIAFLRKITEDMAIDSRGAKTIPGLMAPLKPYYANSITYLDDNKTVSNILYFFDFQSPIWYEFPLPEGKFKAEYIDPWAMTITPIDGDFTGNSPIRLMGRAYQAIRFTRI